MNDVVPIEIEEKPTPVSLMKRLVEQLEESVIVGKANPATGIPVKKIERSLSSRKKC